MEDEDFLKEIREGFLAEAGDMLDQAEACLLALEKNPSDHSVFDTLLRVMHNLKGSGKAVGFDAVSHFSHQLETLMASLRSGEVPVTTEVMGLLLVCCDRMKKDLALLQSDPAAVLDHGALLDRLASAASAKDAELADGLAEMTKAELQTPVPPPSAPEERSADATPIALAKSEDSVRVSLRKIEDLLNNFGEQVILQATLDHVKFDLDRNRDLALKTINQLSKLTYDLQQTTIALRMVTLKQLFSKLERTARDTAVGLQKNIRFTIEGHDNELDKTIVDALSDPLTHMVRNAVDHGLETDEERATSRKDPTGVISLRGFRRGGHFYIVIEDDGRGMDKDRIFKKAVQAGLVKPDAVMTDSEIYELIYRNGFSTRDVASDISGRGVGMNVVQDSIRRLKGTCLIESTLGSGTRFTIRLPLTLAIFNGMVVRIHESTYIIPNSDIERVLAFPAQGVRKISQQGDSVVDVEGSVLPLADLRKALPTPARSTSTDGASANPGTIVITNAGGSRRALIVDEIIAQQRVVHKTLGAEVGNLRGAAGATILGDGSAAIILDVSVLVSGSRERAA